MRQSPSEPPSDNSVKLSHYLVWISQDLVGCTSILRYTSRLETSKAFAWMNSRRGSTRSPISVEQTSSALSAWLILAWNSERALGSGGVSQSCSAFISPRPLY